MRLATLRSRSLRHFWRTNLAVVLGVATAVATLAGSLLVGESVRSSLARLALERLGETELAVEALAFFRDDLAREVLSQPGFHASRADVVPLLALTGSAAHAENGRHAQGVLVYGVDERFFSFHGRAVPAGLEGRVALLSEALAAELEAADGDSLLLRASSPSEIPGSTLFGRRDEPSRNLRLRVAGRLAPGQMGAFSLRPSQRDVRAVFLPLATLQRTLGLAGRANTLLVGGSADARVAKAPSTRPSSAGSTAHGDLRDGLGRALAESLTLDDLGLRLRALPARGELALESKSALLDDELVRIALEAARGGELTAFPVFIYLANGIQVNGRSAPYSLVAALDEEGLARLPGRPGVLDPSSLLLNAWAASDLGARPGDRVRLEYYLWQEEGRLETATTELRLAGVVPLEGLAADRDLVPEYPGITASLHLADWDPPFAVDLARIRPKDERYWDAWRTTPKAFLPLATAQKIWGHRLGRVTSVRLVPPPGMALEVTRARFDAALRSALATRPEDLAQRGVVITPVREQALQAARGTTDFGEYFVYFSFFLVVAALLLAGLFFRLGLEQRLSEVGLLRALGFTPRSLLGQFLGEGLWLGSLGALLGLAGAVAYAGVMLWALRTVWVGAVSTRELAVHVSAGPLVLGALAGLLAAILAIAWTLRGLLGRSPRALLAGALDDWAPPRRSGPGVVAPAMSLLALVLLGASVRGWMAPAAAFFGAGALLLAASLVFLRRQLASRPAEAVALPSVAALGRRGATYRPGRSLLCIALVAGAAFVIASVGAFRRGGGEDLRKPDSESGGFVLMGAALTPLHSDPGTPPGQASLGLPKEALRDVHLARFRRRAGDDGSCLNLYRPTRPTVLGATPDFLRQGRFAFQASLAETEAERKNPWLLLEREPEGGVLPVAVDGNSLAYVLHKRLGDVVELGDRGIRVRVVAALRPGLFQSELVTAEKHFLKAFPEDDGYRFFLFDVPPGREVAVTEALEKHLSDYGFDVEEAAARLLAFHRVENTYITTFQTLGLLGLLLGTVGLATVLLRNALERRRELALLRAVGFGTAHIRRMVLAENALLLGLGLGAGVAAALVAILPALLERGSGAPLRTVAALVLAVSVTGILVSWLAVAVIARLPLVASLRSE